MLLDKGQGYHTGQPHSKELPKQTVSGVDYVTMLRLLSGYVPLLQFISRCMSFLRSLMQCINFLILGDKTYALLNFSPVFHFYSTKFNTQVFMPDSELHEIFTT